MTLVSSGELFLRSFVFQTRSIRYEVELGENVTPYSFSQAVANSDPSVGSMPRRFSDFYGHSQSINGRYYGGNEGFGDTSWLSVEGGYLEIGDGDYETYLGPSDGLSRWGRLVKSNTGTYYNGAEGLNVQVYRRTKATSNSFSLVQTWLNYSSQQYYMATGTYDYHWYIYN